MSLYGDLDTTAVKEKEKPKEEEKRPTWEANLKLLQTHIQLKKATLIQHVKQRSTASGSSTDHSRRRIETKSVIVAETLFSCPSERNSLFEDLHVEDEYNPFFPNDYEKLARRRDEERRKRREEEKKKAADERQKRGRFDSDEDEEEDRGWKKEREKRSGGAAIAPPPSLIASRNESEKRQDEPDSTSGGLVKPIVGSSKGLNVAAKIMEKYGYRQGGGLGKSEQGMSTALQVEKTGLRGGKIIHEKDNAPREFTMHGPTVLPGIAAYNSSLDLSDDNGPSITELLKNPTKVVLLNNMVGPGQVDDELYGEVREEMSKYGDVVDVMIFEAESAVRIFVEYPKIDQAIKALVALNGRFFGGRSIRAAFYNYDRYKAYQFGDD